MKALLLLQIIEPYLYSIITSLSSFRRWDENTEISVYTTGSFSYVSLLDYVKSLDAIVYMQEQKKIKFGD